MLSPAVLATRPRLADIAGSIDSGPQRPHTRERTFLIRASEPAIASHIRRQDRREFAGFSHDVLPPQARLAQSRSELARLDRETLGPTATARAMSVRGPSRQILQRKQMSALGGTAEVGGACSKRRK